MVLVKRLLSTLAVISKLDKRSRGAAQRNDYQITATTALLLIKRVNYTFITPLTPSKPRHVEVSTPTPLDREVEATLPEARRLCVPSEVAQLPVHHAVSVWRGQVLRLQW